MGQTEIVVYVVNDILLRKDPGQPPVFVKQLVSRNPNLTEHVLHRRKRLGFKSPSLILFQEHGAALQILI